MVLIIIAIVVLGDLALAAWSWSEHQVDFFLGSLVHALVILPVTPFLLRGGPRARKLFLFLTFAVAALNVVLVVTSSFGWSSFAPIYNTLSALFLAVPGTMMLRSQLVRDFYELRAGARAVESGRGRS